MARNEIKDSEKEPAETETSEVKLSLKMNTQIKNQTASVKLFARNSFSRMISMNVMWPSPHEYWATK